MSLLVYAPCANEPSTWLTIISLSSVTTHFIIGPLLRFTRIQGVHNCLYCIWDICDDLIFRKVNESDASAFAKLFGGSPQCHGFIWLLISIGFFACGMIVGIVAFKRSEQTQEADPFLKTNT